MTTNERLNAILDLEDLAHDDLRSILMEEEDVEPETDYYDELNTLFHQMTEEEQFNLRLEFSICPIHFCDYAICFDDDDPGCAHVRAEHPSYDV